MLLVLWYMIMNVLRHPVRGSEWALATRRRSEVIQVEDVKLALR
jgi:hypothetical protein